MVYQIIDEVYKMIGRPIDDIQTLIKNCDSKVWDLYANGLTTTINQADSDFDKQILKKYKPQNLAELSAYVAAIRPGFASLLSNFVDRLPYTTGVKELDDILEDSFHYLIYQESIMKYLVWLGVEEKGTYDIIKKIAKKKFKEDELKELKEKLLKGWVSNVGKEEGFNETWQVVEDAAHYSFNASHSLSVAIDSLYGAYLKAHYPLEYFTVTLSLYSGDMERTANLISEMNYFNIELKPIKFRHSTANYNMDKETNSIYKGVGAVKFLNVEVSEKLYAMRSQKFESFFDFLDMFPGNSRQREILIKLGYCEEFWKSAKLLGLCNLYDSYHGKKLIKKDKTALPTDLLQKYAVSETEKQYKFTPESMDALLRELETMAVNEDIPLAERLQAELEFLGYISYTDPSREDTGLVLNIDTKYSPKISVYLLATGETVVYKLAKAAYQRNPFDKGKVIRFYSEERPKSKLVDGTWVKDNSVMEPWITNYLVQDL